MTVQLNAIDAQEQETRPDVQSMVGSNTATEQPAPAADRTPQGTGTSGTKGDDVAGTGAVGPTGAGIDTDTDTEEQSSPKDRVRIDDSFRETLLDAVHTAYSLSTLESLSEEQTADLNEAWAFLGTLNALRLVSVVKNGLTLAELTELCNSLAFLRGVNSRFNEMLGEVPNVMSILLSGDPQLRQKVAAFRKAITPDLNVDRTAKLMGCRKADFYAGIGILAIDSDNALKDGKRPSPPAEQQQDRQGRPEWTSSFASQFRAIGMAAGASAEELDARAKLTAELERLSEESEEIKRENKRILGEEESTAPVTPAAPAAPAALDAAGAPAAPAAPAAPDAPVSQNGANHGKMGVLNTQVDSKDGKISLAGAYRIDDLIKELGKATTGPGNHTYEETFQAKQTLKEQIELWEQKMRERFATFLVGFDGKINGIMRDMNNHFNWLENTFATVPTDFEPVANDIFITIGNLDGDGNTIEDLEKLTEAQAREYAESIVKDAETAAEKQLQSKLNQITLNYVFSAATQFTKVLQTSLNILENLSADCTVYRTFGQSWKASAWRAYLRCEARLWSEASYCERVANFIHDYSVTLAEDIANTITSSYIEFLDVDILEIVKMAKAALGQTIEELRSAAKKYKNCKVNVLRSAIEYLCAHAGYFQQLVDEVMALATPSDDDQSPFAGVSSNILASLKIVAFHYITLADEWSARLSSAKPTPLEATKRVSRKILSKVPNAITEQMYRITYGEINEARKARGLDVIDPMDLFHEDPESAPKADVVTAEITTESATESNLVPFDPAEADKRLSAEEIIFSLIDTVMSRLYVGSTKKKQQRGKGKGKTETQPLTSTGNSGTGDAQTPQPASNAGNTPATQPDSNAGDTPDPQPASNAGDTPATQPASNAGDTPDPQPASNAGDTPDPKPDSDFCDVSSAVTFLKFMKMKLKDAWQRVRDNSHLSNIYLAWRLLETMLESAHEKLTTVLRQLGEPDKLCYSKTFTACKSILGQQYKNQLYRDLDTLGQMLGSKSAVIQKSSIDDSEPVDKDPELTRWTTDGNAFISNEQRLLMAARFIHEGKDIMSPATWITYAFQRSHSKVTSDPSGSGDYCGFTEKELYNVFRCLTGFTEVSSKSLWRYVEEKMGFTMREATKFEQVGTAHPLKEIQNGQIIPQILNWVDYSETLVISCDVKALIVLGNLKRDNKRFLTRKKACPVRKKEHDFATRFNKIYPNGHPRLSADRLKEYAILHPVGAYVLNDQTGFINLIAGHDTSDSMVNLIMRVVEIKKDIMPGLKQVLILADSGGSNAANSAPWLTALYSAAATSGIGFIVCHYSSGTSKKNPIEGKLFGKISLYLKGAKLMTIEDVEQRMRMATTAPGKYVDCVFDGTGYMTVQEKIEAGIPVFTRDDLLRIVGDSICYLFSSKTILHKQNYMVFPTAEAAAAVLARIPLDLEAIEKTAQEIMATAEAQAAAKKAEEEEAEMMKAMMAV